MAYKTTHYNEDGKPPCTVNWRNKPNFKLMAQAFINLHNMPNKDVKIESVKN